MVQCIIMYCIIMSFLIMASILSSFLLVLIMSNTSLILLRWIIIMFSYQNTLTEEQAILAEGNQYTCDVCNKSFALRTTFRSHWHTHKQKSQCSCNVCDKSFYHKSNLININAYILENVRSLAVCVISPTVIRVFWSSILTFRRLMSTIVDVPHC